MKTGVVIPAAGSGSRTGLKENKIFLPIGGEPMLKKTVHAFLSHPQIDLVCVVCAPGEEEKIRSLLGDTVLYALGGKTRGASVYNGLLALKGKADTVLVHDAARPFIHKETVSAVIGAVKSGQGAVAAVPVTDTVKQVDDGHLVTATPAREKLWAAQTPQGFLLAELLDAYTKVNDLTLSDDAAVFEKAGGRVAVVEGTYDNKKITTGEDVAMAEFPYTGFGMDVHAFAPDRALVLGGVTVPYTYGLAGHSDADVLVHAVMDAILAAAGLRDIGYHFPDSDMRFQGISSMVLLQKVVAMVEENGYHIRHISAVIAAQKPKLSSYIPQMNENIAACVHLPVQRVNVAATTTEHLGFEGRLEGISARAVATLAGR